MRIPALFLLLSVIGYASAQEMDRADTMEADWYRFYYEVYGDGPPLLLLHGWTQTSAFWSSMIASLSKDYQVYVLDLPGHGRSGLLPEDFTVQNTAEHLLEVMDQLDLDSVHAVGLSFGGILLLESAVRRPEAFSALVLIGSVYEFDGKNTGEPVRWQELPEAYIQSLLDSHPSGESQLDRLFDPELDYQVHLDSEDLHRVHVPTLVITGDGDQVAGLDQALMIYRLLPDASLWVMPDQGHVPVDEYNRDEFVRQIRLFFLRQAFIR